MRKQLLVQGEYYHIYNRGVDKRDIFSDKNDLYRFIESIKEFNNSDRIGSLRDLKKRKKESKTLQTVSKVSKSKAPFRGSLVNIVAYCLNPNHFHFILKQNTENGIAKFMQKLQAGYTSYFNNKNFRSGSLFQGTFKSNLISNENYFNKLLGYINKNYNIHDIPENKKDFIFAGDFEYENSNFDIISKEEGERILEIFGGISGFKKHSDEIVKIMRNERGKISLIEDENLPDSA